MLKQVLVVLAAAALALPLHAQEKKEDGKKPTAQQQKMAACNKQAGDKSLKGDERRKFMSECLSAKKPASQQDKMARCNKEAGAQSLKGDERKKFMSSCLKS